MRTITQVSDMEHRAEAVMQPLGVEVEQDAHRSSPRAYVGPTDAARQVGFWAAVLTAIFSAGWLITLIVQSIVAPIPKWRGAEAYVHDFSRMQQLPLYPSLLLAPAFVVLLACIHLGASREKKVWSLSALAIGVIYATMATINYSIQLVSVRLSLLHGESSGVAMFAQANPHSITAALGNSYVYMSVAMFFAAFVFGRGRPERRIRWLLIVAGLAAPLQLAWSLFDVDVIAISILPWTIGAVGATSLLALRFRTEGLGHGEAG